MRWRTYAAELGVECYTRDENDIHRRRVGSHTYPKISRDHPDETENAQSSRFTSGMSARYSPASGIPHLSRGKRE
jgi:hypothetical protein